MSEVQGLTSSDSGIPDLSALAGLPQSALDALPIGLYVCDAEGAILRYNRYAAELWGRSPRLGEHSERYCGSFRLYQLDGAMLAHANAPIADVLRTGRPVYGAEVVVQRPDGSRRTALANIEALTDAHGGVIGAVNCFQDITDRKADDLELRRKTQDLEDFFENGAVGLHWVSGDGIILRANRAELELLGYKPEEYIGRNIADFHADEVAINDILTRLTRGEKLDKYPARLLAKDGSIKHVLITSNVQFRDGQFVNTRCFTLDVTEQHLAEEASRASERRARDILESLPTAIYTTDADGRITFYNRAAVDFSGREPVLGSDEWCVSWRLYSPDGTPLPHDQCPMALALRTGEPVRGAQAVAERPDGTRVPFEPYPTPLKDENGRVIGAVNMLLDISDRKQAEEQQRLLIHELNHRVKNTLATVQSIAALTIRSAPDVATFGKTFQQRLLALSKAHELLTRQFWQGVSLREILTQELAPYVQDTDQAVLDGPDVTLEPRVGLALTLVIHELATNAAKYGPPSTAEGQVAVRWNVTPAGSERPAMLELTWTETGGPAVVAPTRHGFGTRLIERSVTKDLRGEVELGFEPAGLRCTLKVPISRD